MIRMALLISAMALSTGALAQTDKTSKEGPKSIVTFEPGEAIRGSRRDPGLFLIDARQDSKHPRFTLERTHFDRKVLDSVSQL